jgi:hypothetical protein
MQREEEAKRKKSLMVATNNVFLVYRAAVLKQATNDIS